MAKRAYYPRRAIGVLQGPRPSIFESAQAAREARAKRAVRGSAVLAKIDKSKIKLLGPPPNSMYDEVVRAMRRRREGKKRLDVKSRG